MTVQDMREILAAALAKEYLMKPRTSISKLLKDMQDVKYKDDAYISLWYLKFFKPLP